MYFIPCHEYWTDSIRAQINIAFRSDSGHGLTNKLLVQYSSHQSHNLWLEQTISSLFKTLRWLDGFGPFFNTKLVCYSDPTAVRNSDPSISPSPDKVEKRFVPDDDECRRFWSHPDCWCQSRVFEVEIQILEIKSKQSRDIRTWLE